MRSVHSHVTDHIDVAHQRLLNGGGCGRTDCDLAVIIGITPLVGGEHQVTLQVTGQPQDPTELLDCLTPEVDVDLVRVDLDRLASLFGSRRRFGDRSVEDLRDQELSHFGY